MIFPNMGFSAAQADFMRRALALAARGRGRVEPNPMVGCVLVKGERIIGEGYHRRFGGPHAEVEALRSAGPSARGATVYVTLEPCCHFGKTPPCTDALLAAGIRRVVAAMRDPFPKVCGHGLEILCKAGVNVDVGLCEQEAIELNAPYLKRQKLGLPWVILKWAQSIDGKIATRTGDSKWISNERSRLRVHQLRGRVDAIIVGVGTVIADDPALTCRQGRPRRIATRVILDPHLRTPRRSQLVRTARATPTMIVTSRESMKSSTGRVFERAGVKLMPVRHTRGRLDLREMLARLAETGCTNVLVEGGGRTLGAFVDQGLADEAVVFVSRRFIGGSEAVSPLAATGPAMMNDICHPWRVTLARCGSDDVYRVSLTDPAILMK
jgi:diaminohydroxyphosphoribosylaminopyrimidine deaminase / 5-amino-6-(5-phosphoribosylamino)uracil reductase